MSTKHINYKGKQVDVDILEENTFCVHLQGKDVRIQYMPDNEGADHWMDLEQNKETEEAVSLGECLGGFVVK